jgi:hypothetical protein
VTCVGSLDPVCFLMSSVLWIFFIFFIFCFNKTNPKLSVHRQTPPTRTNFFFPQKKKNTKFGLAKWVATSAREAGRRA